MGILRPPAATEGVALRTIHREPLVVALPAGHPLAAGAEVAVSSLAAEPFVLFPRSMGPGLYDQILGLCRSAGFSPRVVQEAVRMKTITSLVAAGIGVSLVPESVRHLARPGVIYRDVLSAPTVELAAA